MELDVSFIRTQYPAFQDSATKDWAFFENAGGSYVPQQVIERLNRFFREYKVQPYGPFPSSEMAGTEMDAGYQCVADLLNARVEDLTLGPSTSMNTYVLAQAFRPLLQSGDEIIVTNQDHEANIGCWERLAEFGVEIKRWKIRPDDGELLLEDLESLLSSRTRLVAFSLCSNIVGSINNVQAISDLAHRVGAWVVADGVSYAPHRLVDVNRLGADVYLFSTYKTFGTHLGVMWVRPELSSQLACQGHYFNDQRPHYHLNPCGPLHAEIAALAGIGEYFSQLAEHHFGAATQPLHERTGRLFELFAQHEAALASRLLAAWRDDASLRIIGQNNCESDTRAPTVSVVPREFSAAALAKKMAERSIAVRSGHFYALRCLQALRIEDPADGVLRVSMVHYNTLDEVQRLVDAWQAL